MVHELPDGVGEQCRPRTRLVPRGVQEDRCRVRLLPPRSREQLVSALHPQPRQPDPLWRPLPSDPRPRRHPPNGASGRNVGLRGRLHGGASRRPDLQDVGSEGQEDRYLQEPEHHQERLVAYPGAHGHLEHADAQRHDHGRHRARRVPVSRRLVRQAGDARPADEQPVGAVDAPRPQARLGVPSARDGAAQGRRRRDLHPEQGLPAPPGGDRQDRDDRGPLQVSRTGESRWPTRRPSSPAPT